jgi:F-type H+-transporting ATPase subunit delta
VKLSSNQTEALVSKLKVMTKAEQIKLDLKVDPNLIGGFKVQIGSKIIDTSVQNQLRQLSSYLGSSVI